MINLQLLTQPQKLRRVCYKCCNFFFKGYAAKSVALCKNYDLNYNDSNKAIFDDIPGLSYIQRVLTDDIVCAWSH